MERGMSRVVMLKWFFLFVMAVSLICITAPAFSAEKAIAKLTSYSGTVLIKSQGNWGVKAEKDLPLYSDDKVVTKIGMATITFDDGAVMDLKANSNLLIRETTEEKGAGGVAGTAKRQLRLLLGKMMFQSGKGTNVKTTLETTTFVCGLRGTAGTLSVDAAGQTYIQFTEGAGDSVGNFISGVASDVPTELANLNPAQRAVFVAVAAATQAAQVSEKLATGEVTNADAALASARAAEAGAIEAKAAAEAMLTNPSAIIQAEATAAVIVANTAIEAAKAAEAQAINAGASQTVAPPVETLTTVPTTTTTTTTETTTIETTQGQEADILIGDVTPPVVQTTATPKAITNLSDANFEFIADEDVTYSYTLDGGAAVTVGQYTKGTPSDLSLSGLTEGGHEIILTATDTAGNASTTSYPWTTDYTAPVASIVTEPASIANTSNFGFDAADTNKSAGITYQYQIGDGAWTTISGSSLASILSGSADGTYTINVKATDAAGNTSTATSYTWIYDTTAPALAITAKPASVANTSDFAFDATDTNKVAGITYQYSLDGSTWTTTSEALALGWAKDGSKDNSYTIYVKATDAAGNTGTTSYNWTYDTIAPTVALSAAPDESGTTATITARYTNSEPSTKVTWVINDVAGSAEGEHTIYVTATDEAGNTSTPEFHFFLQNFTLSGAVAGIGSAITGKIELGAASVIKDDNWGGWRIEESGEGTASSGAVSLMSGGANEYYSSGYNYAWLSSMTGNVDGAGLITGTTDFRLLSPTSLSTGTGAFTGAFSDGTWTGTETGSGLTNTALSFFSAFDSNITHSVNEYSGGYSDYIGGGYSRYYYDYYGDGSYAYADYYSWYSSELEDGRYQIDYYDDGSYSGRKEVYNVDLGYWQWVPISGNWDDPTDPFYLTSLKDVMNPPAAYGDDYFDSYEYTYSDRDTSAYAYGLLGGTTSLFTGFPVHVTAIGQFYKIDDNMNASIWGNSINSYNYTDDTNTTYDGGAYTAYMGGIKNGDALKGLLLGLYIAPTQNEDGTYNAGYLTGSLAGTVYKDLGMFEMDGAITQGETVAAVAIAPEDLTSNIWGNDSEISMTQGGGYGGYYYAALADDSGVIQGYGGFNTVSIVDFTNYVPEPWGLWGANMYGSLTGSLDSGWTSLMGGYGGFGAYVYSYTDGETVSHDLYNDDGFFLGDISNGTWTGNELSADFTGRYITNTKLGTLTGNMIGTYYADTNTWEAMGLGTYSGTDLAYVSNFRFNIYHAGNYDHKEYISYIGDRYSYYQYSRGDDYIDVTFNRDGSGAMSDPDFIPSEYYHIEYHEDGSYSGYKQLYDATAQSYYDYYFSGNWKNTGDNYHVASLDELMKAPAIYGSNYYVNYDWWHEYYFPDDLNTYYSGSMNGLLGGTTSLFGTQDTGIPVTVLGSYYSYGEGKGSIWGSELYSYNYKNRTYTTYDDGAYMGALEGIKNGDVLKGLLSGLYIAPTTAVDAEGNAIYSAGYLNGYLEGNVYNSIGMFDMDGTIDRTQVVADIGIAASDLINNIWDTGYGYGGLEGGLGDASISSGGYGGFYTASIVDNNNYIPQSWGVWGTELLGRFDGAMDNEWSASMGGYGGFGAYVYSYTEGDTTYKYLYNDNGYFLGDIANATWADNEFSADFSGKYITDTRMGVISGDILGTYNADLKTWEAVGLGIYSGTDLAYVSSIGANIANSTDYSYGRYYYTGRGYSSYYYELSPSNNYVYVEYDSNGSGGLPYDDYYIYYYEDGSYSGSGYNLTNGSYYITGNWKDPADPYYMAALNDAMNPPAIYGENYYIDYQENYPSYASTGYAHGLLGGTTSLFGVTGDDISVTAMGQFNTNDKSAGNIFFSSIYSNNYKNDTYTTYDNGAYFGYLGGAGYKSDLNGILSALYIAPTKNSDGSYNAGYLEGSLKGSTYSNIGMFGMEGDIDRNYKTTVNIAPEDLQNNLFIYSYSESYLAGDFGADSISGYGNFSTASINNELWGVYGSTLTGGTGNSAIMRPVSTDKSWTAAIGGEGSFGAYNVYNHERMYYSSDYNSYYNYQYDDNNSYAHVYYYNNGSSSSYDYYDIYYYSDGTWEKRGYYGSESGTWSGDLATVISTTIIPATDYSLYSSSDYLSGQSDYGYYLGTTSPATAANGEIAATFSGKFLTGTKMGDISGGILGSYNADTGNWEAVNIGTWGGVPLDFGGDIYGGYDMDRSDMGLFGLVDNDSTYDFLSIGQYYSEEGYMGIGDQTYIWAGSLYGNQIINNSESGNKMMGFIAGGSQAGVNGSAALIYFTEGGTVGLLSGDLTGSFYDLSGEGYGGMYMSEGTLAETVTEQLPEGYTSANIEPAMLEATFAGSFGDSANNTIFSTNNKGELNFVSYYDSLGNYNMTPWGIYDLKFGLTEGYGPSEDSTFSGLVTTSGTATWTVSLGGYFGGGYDGYWLAGIDGTWSDTSEGAYGTIDGDLSGIYLTEDYLGRLTGAFYGMYMDEGTNADGSYGVWGGESLGTYTAVPLVYSGYVHGKEGSDGLMGLTESQNMEATLLTTSYDVIFLGEQALNTPFWMQIVEGGSVDDGNTSFVSLMNIRSWENALTGNVVGLYKKTIAGTETTYEYGLMDYAGISGTYYPGIDMWAADSTVSFVPSVTLTSDLYTQYSSFGGETSVNGDAFTGNIVGGTIDYTDNNTVTLDWGIFDSISGGSAGTFIPVDEEGYWLSPVIGTYAGTSYTAYSDLYYLTESTMGSYSGTATSGDTGATWATTGSVTSSALAYSGSDEGGLYYYDIYNTWVNQSAGNEFGLIGGLTAPWSGSSYFLSMGTYDPFPKDVSSYAVQNSYISGGNDAGTFSGFTASAWLDDAIVGKSIAFYSLDDEASTIGIISADITGNYYNDLGMWMTEGVFEPVITGPGIIDPTIYSSEGTWGMGNYPIYLTVSSYYQNAELNDGRFLYLWSDTGYGYYYGLSDPSGQFASVDKEYYGDGAYIEIINGLDNHYGLLSMDYYYVEMDLLDGYIEKEYGNYFGNYNYDGSGYVTASGAGYGIGEYYDFVFGGEDFNMNTQGIFGLTYDSEASTYDLIAIGGYEESGDVGFIYNNNNSYLWSGKLLGDEIVNYEFEDGGIAGYTVGSSKVVSGNNGYAALIYYNEDGVGLLTGNINNDFTKMYEYEGYGYGGGIFEAEGTLTKTVVDQPEDYATSYNSGEIWVDPYMLGASMYGSFGDGGEIYANRYSIRGETQTISYYDYTAYDYKTFNWGIYDLDLGDDYNNNYFYGKSEGQTDWSAMIGGGGFFGYGGYFIADVTGVWSAKDQEDNGTISGSLSGWYLTNTHIGSISGPVYGIYYENGFEDGYGGYGYWVGESAGTFAATETLDFGGEYYTAYGMNPGMKNGAFGLLYNEVNEDYDFLALGEYNYNEGYSTIYGGYGGYLWGGMLYGNDVTTDGESGYGGLYGYTAGSSWADESGNNGSGAFIYYTEAGEVGLMVGSLNNRFYDMYSDGGMFYIEGSLTARAKTAPEGFDPSYAWVEPGMLMANLSGSFGDSLDDTVSIYPYMTRGETQFIAYEDTTDSYNTRYLNWGVYDLRLGDSYSYNSYYDKPAGEISWTAKIGGAGTFATSGYYLADITGLWSAEDINGTGSIEGALSGEYLSETSMGTISGPVYGMYYSCSGNGYGGYYDNGYWIAESAGTFEETQTLDFGGRWGDTTDCLYYFDANNVYLNNTGYDNGLIGLTKNTDGNYDLLAIGEYYDYNNGYSNEYGRSYVWYSPIDGDEVGENKTGGFGGYTGGSWNSVLVDDSLSYKMNGYASAIAGNGTETTFNGMLLYGAVSGDIFEMSQDGSGYGGMWKATGTLNAVDMGEVTLSFDPVTGEPVENGCVNFDGSGLFTDDTGNTIASFTVDSTNGDATNLIGYNWGAWSSMLGGTIVPASETAATSWDLSLVDTQTDLTRWAEISGVVSMDTNELLADFSGAWVNVTDAATGVMGGGLVGTFDPNRLTWQAAAVGIYIDTNTFLTMTGSAEGIAKLNQLNIPAIEIGRTNLTGTSFTGALTSVNMNDVTFFAYSTGNSPRIWATGDVSGATNASGAAVNGSTATLNGAGFNNSVNFTVNNYGTAGGTWNGSINGSGTVTETVTSKTYDVGINGGAAGTVGATGTTFSGTAAGVATKK